MHVKNQIYAVDHHHGQASRTVLSGYPFIVGETMRDKANYYLENLSWIHESLIREPRGHINMLGSIVTAPVSKDSAFGLLFLHAFGLFDGCGDSTFCAATAALETGIVQPVSPITRFSIDTVLGPLAIEADVSPEGVVQQVRFGNVPSYHVGDLAPTVPGIGPVKVQVAFGGLYFGFIDACSVGVTIAASDERNIVAKANAIFNAIGDDLDLIDPNSGETIPLDLITFVHRDEVKANSYTVANVYKPGRMGRTPSGTGTSAHIALRAATGEYELGKPFVQNSIVGTHFTGTGTATTTAKGTPAVLPVIGAKSYMMAVSQFTIDPADPFANGFVLQG